MVFAEPTEVIITEPAEVIVKNDINVNPPEPPSEPTEVNVLNISTTSAYVSWVASESADQYTVYIDNQPYTGSNAPGISISGLDPDTEYSLHVVSVNSGGMSGNSETVSFKTLPQVISPPESITIINHNQDTICFQWTPVLGATRYLVKNNEIVYSTTKNNYEISDLESDTQYQISVVAVDDEENESVPIILEAKTLPYEGSLGNLELIQRIYEYTIYLEPYIVAVFAVVIVFALANVLKISI